MDTTIVDQMNTQSIWVYLMPVLTAAITAVATLFAVFLTNRSSQNRLRLQLEHEREQNDEDKNTSRLEELYIMIGHDAGAATSYYIPFISASTRQVTLQWARNKSMEEGFKSAPDQQRLEMMFHLHYPQLRSDFDLFKAVVQDVFKKWKPCEEALERDQAPTNEQKDAFVVAWLLIEMRAKDLKEQVAKLII